MTNNRNREVAPAIPFAFIHGTNGLTITTTPVAMQWSMNQFITKDFTFNANGTRIFINRGTNGIIYKLYAQAGALKATGNPDYLKVQLYINGSAVDCCIAHGAISQNEDHADVTLITAFYANVGDFIEIYVSVDNGTAEIETDSARLIIEGLPMRGWNNSAAGKIKIRGQVAR